MQVVMVETFEGVRGRLGRCAIVEVKANDERSARWELQKYRYSKIEELTIGAIPSEQAKEIALKNAPANMLVFMADAFEVNKIAG